MENKLTKKEAVRLHRILWNTIADILEEEGIVDEEDPVFLLKDKALLRMKNAEHFNGGLPINGCFCCEYSLLIDREDFTCWPYCPITWHNNRCSSSEYGLFNYFIYNYDINGSIKEARTIANLPERPDQDLDIF